MKEFYVVWEFEILDKFGNEKHGAKNTLMDLDEINNSHFENPGAMDEINWLNAGLFFDEIIMGSQEKHLPEGQVFVKVHVYGFYRTQEDAQAAFDTLSRALAGDLKKYDRSLN